jgi:hypothetical protein
MAADWCIGARPETGLAGKTCCSPRVDRLMTGGMQMDRIKVGDVLEFVEPAHVDGKTIARGTKVRVGYIEEEVLEPNVTVVVLDATPPQTLTLPRHVVALHCEPSGGRA